MQSLNGSVPGSSPRGRGKPRPKSRGAPRGRLIPARAGKTRLSPRAPGSGPAHPRAGGENAMAVTTTQTATGSSPRGRGKPSRSWRGRRGPRLIPARAGKTLKTASIAPVDWAHPRAGGENALPALKDFAGQGSSPRGRGKRARRLWRRCWPGLIPARAGKTLSEARFPTGRRAHPRAGGENLRRVCGRARRGGSSPRGRGKRFALILLTERKGLIPARAGKTWRADRPTAARPAHPRAGGENWMFSAPQLVRKGSSPRGRGKHGRGG